MISQTADTPRDHPRLAVELTTATERTVLGLEGELDIATVGWFERAIERVTPEAGLVVLDLRALRFTDSVGLRAILALERRTREHGGRFAIVRGKGTVARLLALMRLDEALEVVDEPQQLPRPLAGLHALPTDPGHPPASAV